MLGGSSTLPQATKFSVMKFVNFLDSIPEENKSYLAKTRGKDGGWYNKLIHYWGMFNGKHHIEDNRGFHLDPKDVMYLDEQIDELSPTKIFGCDCGQPSCSICG